MNKRNGINFAAMLVGLLVMSGPIQAVTLNTYHVGNSLTWDAQVGGGLVQLAADAGHTLTTGYHIRCGRPLDFIIDNPGSVCVEPNEFGYYTDAFANNAWDAITLQPHSGATPREEYEAAKALIQLARQNSANSDTRFYLYATWGTLPETGTSFYDKWYDPTPTDPDVDLIRNANGFGWIYNALRTDPDLYGVDLYVIPAGYVLAEVDQRMRAGQIPGFSGVDEIYRDDVHMTNFGRFIASNTYLATLFEEDPTGTPTNNFFLTSPGQVTPITITEQLATLVQDAVWDVVSAYPNALPLPGDANYDGFVGLDDLDVILQSWNQNVVVGAPGDISGPAGEPDGYIGLDDLDLVLGNWNTGTPPAAGADVPEPGSLGVLAVYGMALLRMRKRS